MSQPTVLGVGATTPRAISDATENDDPAVDVCIERAIRNLECSDDPCRSSSGKDSDDIPIGSRKCAKSGSIGLYHSGTGSPMPSWRGTLSGLRERERQITSTIAVVAVTAVVFVVVVVDDVGINGCVTSASAPEVHVFPGQGWRRRASRGGKVFPRGQRWRQSNPKVVE